MNCWHCGRAIEGRERIGFREDCPGCGRALHACRNCGFYDTAYNNSCRETQAERVVEKERFNFCEYFAPLTGSRGGGAAAGPPRSSARSRLEDLFKKK